MYWSQTESSKWSLDSLSHDLGHPCKAVKRSSNKTNYLNIPVDTPRCSGSGGARLFASTVRGHTQDRRPLSARRTPPREQSTSHPTLGSPCWASTASQFRPSRAIVVTRRSCSMCEPVLEAGRRSPDRASVLPILPAAPWSSAGLSRSCALVPRSIGGVSLAYQGITRGGWDAREEATAAGCVAAWF